MAIRSDHHDHWIDGKFRRAFDGDSYNSDVDAVTSLALVPLVVTNRSRTDLASLASSGIVTIDGVFSSCQMTVCQTRDHVEGARFAGGFANYATLAQQEEIDDAKVVRR
jgi:hypothetical protein